jgi:hypothetical protein
MTDETRPNAAESTFRQQREEIARRNDEAHRRGQAERKARERALDVRGRVQAAREADELHELNAQIVKRRTGEAG